VNTTRALPAPKSVNEPGTLVLLWYIIYGETSDDAP